MSSKYLDFANEVITDGAKTTLREPMGLPIDDKGYLWCRIPETNILQRFDPASKSWQTRTDIDEHINKDHPARWALGSEIEEIIYG